jgi:hypothetical protein
LLLPHECHDVGHVVASETLDRCHRPELPVMGLNPQSDCTLEGFVSVVVRGVYCVEEWRASARSQEVGAMAREPGSPQVGCLRGACGFLLQCRIGEDSTEVVGVAEGRRTIRGRSRPRRCRPDAGQAGPVGVDGVADCRGGN